MSTATLQPKRSRLRRCVQFSLRTFLLLVTVAALGLGWEVNRARRHVALMRELQKWGDGDVRPRVVDGPAEEVARRRAVFDLFFQQSS